MTSASGLPRLTAASSTLFRALSGMPATRLITEISSGDRILENIGGMASGTLAAALCSMRAVSCSTSFSVTGMASNLNASVRRPVRTSLRLLLTRSENSWRNQSFRTGESLKVLP